jgi:hypothetical protein
MKSLAWILFGLVIGFFLGFGVPLGIDLLPLLTVTFLGAGYFLISTSHVTEG